MKLNETKLNSNDNGNQFLQFANHHHYFIIIFSLLMLLFMFFSFLFKSLFYFFREENFITRFVFHLYAFVFILIHVLMVEFHFAVWLNVDCNDRISFVIHFNPLTHHFSNAPCYLRIYHPATVNKKHIIKIVSRKGYNDERFHSWMPITTFLPQNIFLIKTNLKKN